MLQTVTWLAVVAARTKENEPNRKNWRLFNSISICLHHIPSSKPRIPEVLSYLMFLLTALRKCGVLGCSCWSHYVASCAAKTHAADCESGNSARRHETSAADKPPSLRGAGFSVGSTHGGGLRLREGRGHRMMKSRRASPSTGQDETSRPYLEELIRRSERQRESGYA